MVSAVFTAFFEQRCYVSGFPLARQLAKREGLTDFNREYRWQRTDAHSLKICGDKLSGPQRTYKHLDSLNLVDRTIDVRKLRADDIVEIRKVISIFGCNHRRVKLIHDLNNAEVVCQSYSINKKGDQIINSPLTRRLTP